METAQQLARRAARAWPIYDPAYSLDDYTQVGLIAILECFSNYPGGGCPEAWAYKSAWQAIGQEFTRTMSQGRKPHRAFNQRLGAPRRSPDEPIGEHVAEMIEQALSGRNPERAALEKLILGEETQAFFDDVWLTDQQARVLEFFMRGYCIQDIADEFGMSRSAVSNQFKWAVQRIREARGLDPSMPITLQADKFELSVQSVLTKPPTRRDSQLNVAGGLGKVAWSLDEKPEPSGYKFHTRNVKGKRNVVHTRRSRRGPFRLLFDPLSKGPQQGKGVKK